MKLEFPFYARTYSDDADDAVECWEWDADAERWRDTEGHSHAPENLHSVTPPFDAHPPTFLDLEVALEASTMDGKGVVLVGFRPFVPDWETRDGQHLPLVNCPRPVLTRYRCLDAPYLVTGYPSIIP